MRRTKQNKNKHEKRIYIEKPRWCSATKLIYVSILNKPVVQAFSSQARGCCCSRKHHFETPKERRKWGESAPTLRVAISTLPNLPMSKTQRWQLQQQEHEQAVFAAQNTPALQANFECLSPL